MSLFKNTNRSRRVLLREKFSYGFGCMSYNLEICVVMVFLMLFSTDVMKINPMVVGTVFLALKFVDAITDVVITNIADKTKTKWGRYRPWILMGIPLAFALVFSFWFPSFLHTQWQMVVWLCISLLLIDIFETSTYMPIMVMGTTMSAKTHDRLDFASSRTLGEYAAELLVNALCMTIILSFGSYQNIAGWRYMSIVFAAIIIIASLVGFFGTKERVFAENKSASGKQISLLKKLSVLKNNKPFWKVLGVQVAFALQWGLTMVLFSYYCIHNLGHEEWLPILTTTGVAVTIATTALVPFIGRKFDKRPMIFIACALMLISAAVLWFTTGFVGALIFQILKGIGAGLVFTTTGAMWPDVTDYTQWKTGVAVPGIIIATGLFCFKIFNALSSYASGAILSFGGYDPNLEVQSDFTLSTLKGSLVIGIVVCIVVTIIVNWFLRELSIDKVAKYKADIESSMNEMKAAEEKQPISV